MDLEIEVENNFFLTVFTFVNSRVPQIWFWLMIILLPLLRYTFVQRSFMFGFFSSLSLCVLELCSSYMESIDLFLSMVG